LAVSVDDVDAMDRNSKHHEESTRRREVNMSRLLERLLMLIADALDRSLVAVPELDDELPTSVGRPRQGGDPAADRHERQYWKDAATPTER
jgi:hypothetical protein